MEFRWSHGKITMFESNLSFYLTNLSWQFSFPCGKICVLRIPFWLIELFHVYLSFQVVTQLWNLRFSLRFSFLSLWEIKTLIVLDPINISLVNVVREREKMCNRFLFNVFIVKYFRGKYGKSFTFSREKKPSFHEIPICSKQLNGFCLF
jgi:hypothetical protein